jgi:hypothetical protein
MCSSCGREICFECKDALGSNVSQGEPSVVFSCAHIIPHCQSNALTATCSSDPGVYHLQGKNLLPITRFHAGELAHAIDEMKLAMRNGKLRPVILAVFHRTDPLFILSPISHARDDELEKAEKSMEAMLLNEHELPTLVPLISPLVLLHASSLDRPTHTDKEYCPREATTLNCQDINPEYFMECLWPEGYPLVLRGSKIQGNWGPDYWILRYGHQNVTLENCETGETKASTVAEFLCTYGTESLRSETWKLKVRWITPFPYNN